MIGLRESQAPGRASTDTKQATRLDRALQLPEWVACWILPRWRRGRRDPCGAAQSRAALR